MKIGLGWIIALIAAAIIALWGGCGYLLYDAPNDARGTFGDMFGAVNALFSGFAFLGMVYAILLQRQEMTETREVLKQSALAQKLQAAAAAIDALEMARRHANNATALAKQIVEFAHENCKSNGFSAANQDALIHARKVHEEKMRYELKISRLIENHGKEIIQTVETTMREEIEQLAG